MRRIKQSFSNSDPRFSSHCILLTQHRPPDLLQLRQASILARPNTLEINVNRARNFIVFQFVFASPFSDFIQHVLMQQMGDRIRATHQRRNNEEPEGAKKEK
jgi:hypothetical protein